jgi:tRNA 2-thiouridine synthesizing protein B
MLHLVFQSPIASAVLARMNADDEVVFLDNAVLHLLQNNQLAALELLEAQPRYVLADDLALRGIRAEELEQGICIIDYPELVALTLKHPVIQSWT